MAGTFGMTNTTVPFGHHAATRSITITSSNNTLTGGSATVLFDQTEPAYKAQFGQIRILSQGSNGGGVARVFFYDNITSSYGMIKEISIPPTANSSYEAKGMVIINLFDGLKPDGLIVNPGQKILIAIEDGSISDGYQVTILGRIHAPEP